MKSALQPARRNPYAKPAPPDLSIFARRSRAEIGAVTPFRISTCKSVSKQRTLTTFRMNTYAKPGEGLATSTGRGGQQEEPFVMLVQDHVIVRAEEFLFGGIERDDFYFRVVRFEPGDHIFSGLLRRGMADDEQLDIMIG